MTKDSFDKLLMWLDKDRETAAQKYHSMHDRLTKLFLGRKMFPADELADEAIDRVIRNIDSLLKNYQGNPAHYFYKVAKIMCLEYIKKPKELELKPDYILPEAEEDRFEKYYEYLEKCMTSLSDESRNLIVRYVSHNEKSKIERRKLTQELEIDIELLRVKVYRIKKKLKKCINNCFLEKKV